MLTHDAVIYSVRELGKEIFLSYHCGRVGIVSLTERGYIDWKHKTQAKLLRFNFCFYHIQIITLSNFPTP